MDGIIFLLIVAGITGVVIWRRKTKKIALDKAFAEQWDFLRGLEVKIDSLLEQFEITDDAK